MNKIIYVQANGNIAVVNPCEGFRLALSVSVGGKTYSSKSPVPVDSFLRRWPVIGAEVVWAETEDEFINRVALKDVPKGVSYKIVSQDQIPSDRSFRNALIIDGDSISHDIDKCRSIHKDRLREMRNPKLSALDVDFMRALESGDSVAIAEIAAKKQALRDVTKDASLTSAKTPEELKKAIPEVLK